MSRPAPNGRPATYADIEALPEHVVGEIIGGELIVSPRPAPRHASSSSGLGVIVGGPFQYGIGGPGGWWILDEPELHLGPEVLVPDLAGWRLATMGELPDEAYFSTPPDWICEVLSQSTEKVDRARKLAIYALNRVGHVWLLHPIHRTLEVFRLSGDTWTLMKVYSDKDETIRAEPFEEVEIPLGLLWQKPQRPQD